MTIIHHIHVRSGSENFSITIRDRIVDGRAKSKSIVIVNEFLNQREAEVMELLEKAQRGETITKINR